MDHSRPARTKGFAIARSRTDNLKNWLNEPYIQRAVISVLKRADQPLLMREVAQECLVPTSSANRVLCRLYKKGLVTRFKLPMNRHIYCHQRRMCIENGATRLLYVYNWAA